MRSAAAAEGIQVWDGGEIGAIEGSKTVANEGERSGEKGGEIDGGEGLS